MNDFFPTMLVTIAGAMLVVGFSQGLSRRERRWVALSFALHVTFACLQVPLTLSFFGGGDMFVYSTTGEVLAQLMERDPSRAIPEVTKLLFHGRPNLPVLVIGVGTGTGSMSALAAWTFFILGPSRYAACVAFAVLSLCGKIGIYRVFRDHVPADRWPYVAVAALFVPSFLFWSSGLIKEAVVVAGLGWGFYGLHLWIRENRPVLASLTIAIGAVPLLLVKPYVLFPFVLAGGAWYYWSRSLRSGGVRVRPLQLAMAAAVGLGGIVVLGERFPEYSLENFAEQSAALQELGHMGGSAFTLSSETQSTLAGQLLYAPAALVASLFRPFIFEVHNVPSLVNALETTILLLLFVRLVLTRGFLSLWQRLSENPLLAFCLVFVVAFGIAVGLASSNMGTLSRYRAPLLPFFVFLMFELGRTARSPLTVEPEQAVLFGTVHEGQPR